MNFLTHRFAQLVSFAVVSSALVFGANVSQAAEAGGDYTLSRQYGSVFFKVMFQEYLNMVGRFDDYAGTLHLDPENLANSTLTATVQMGSLNMAEGDVTETLVNSSSWFNASIFPEATFKSTAAVVTGDNAVDFNGELTFMGITKPWTLHVKFFGGTDGEVGGSTVGILGTGSFDRNEFGLKEYRNMAADVVNIEVNVKFNRN
jgi:polyisoprenoid-binding protein YceI